METNHRLTVQPTKWAQLAAAASLSAAFALGCVVAFGQQYGLDQPTPQTAQSAQSATQQQSSQLQDPLAPQQGPIDAAQPSQQNQLNQQQQPQDPFGTQNTYNQQGQPAQEIAPPPDRSMMQPGLEQQGGAAMAGDRPGELGVFVIEGAGPGVRIARVATGSAAEAAGLESGDVIMQINGQGVEQPQEVTRLIRRIRAGEIANLQVWRDGQAEAIVATLQPMGARDRYRVGYRSSEMNGMNGMSGDLAQRTQRLEQQLGTVMQELQQLRQEVMRLRTGNMGTTGIDAQTTQGFATSPAEPLDQNATQPGLDKSPNQPATTDTDTGLPF